MKNKAQINKQNFQINIIRDFHILNKEDYEVKNIMADGNCFYRSLSFYYRQTEKDYNEFRKLIVSYIENNLDIYISFISDEEIIAPNLSDIENWTGLGYRKDTIAGTAEEYEAPRYNETELTYYGVYSRNYTANFYSGIENETFTQIESETVYYNTSITTLPTTVSIILDSEAKTKVHGVKLAKFTDWKTIQCNLTENTVTVNWKLYAFDET